MFLPESIDLGHSEKYTLSVRIKPNGFMFAICEYGNSKNYCLRETTFSEGDNLLSNLQRIVFDLNFLTQEFRQTNVIIVSSDYELIPATYMETKEKDSLYNFTQTTRAGHVLSGLIDKEDIVTLFNIEAGIYEFLCRNLWNPQFYHHSNLIANHCENKELQSVQKAKMYINFHDEFMDILCFSLSGLTHSLTFENEPPMNQVYFILKLWEACEFDQINDCVYIIGKPDDMIIIRLQEYIKNIERLNPPSEIYLWSEDAQKAPLDLLTLAL